MPASITYIHGTAETYIDVRNQCLNVTPIRHDNGFAIGLKAVKYEISFVFEADPSDHIFDLELRIENHYRDGSTLSIRKVPDEKPASAK